MMQILPILEKDMHHSCSMLCYCLWYSLFHTPLSCLQWLQPYSQYKVFGWINQFKPLFDTYTGPYKDKHCYWTGLLLLVRIALFTVFSTNTFGDPAINLLAINVTIVCLSRPVCWSVQSVSPQHPGVFLSPESNYPVCGCALCYLS